MHTFVYMGKIIFKLNNRSNHNNFCVHEQNFLCNNWIINNKLRILGNIF